jgi:hypothetical protein
MDLAGAAEFEISIETLPWTGRVGDFRELSSRY